MIQQYSSLLLAWLGTQTLKHMRSILTENRNSLGIKSDIAPLEQTCTGNNLIGGNYPPPRLNKEGLGIDRLPLVANISTCTVLINLSALLKAPNDFKNSVKLKNKPGQALVKLEFILKVWSETTFPYML